MRHWILILSCLAVTLPATAGAQDEAATLSLEQSLQIALENSPAVAAARENHKGADYQRKAARSDFLPKIKGEYNYLMLDQAPSFDFGGDGGMTEILVRDFIPTMTGPLGNAAVDPTAFIPSDFSAGDDQQQTFTGTLEQPIFTGLGLLNKYKLASLETDAAKAGVEKEKEDLILKVTEIYFNVLLAIRLLDVAEQAVESLEGHVRVAQDFFNVGMIPKNDLLKAEVELANTLQLRVRAANGLALAEAAFNITLRREIEAPVSLKDILEYSALERDLETCFQEAYDNRVELQILDIRVDQAKKGVSLARSPLYPTVALFGSFRYEDGTVNQDTEIWTVGAIAKWTPWEWGKKYYNIRAAQAKLEEARRKGLGLRDLITLEVKRAYLSLKEAEANIGVAEKSIEQAVENYRITEEQYKATMTTSTEVLDAQTLLNQARVNYNRALTDYNIGLARLKRATGTLFATDTTGAK